MAEKSKLKTPDWILEGYSSKEEYERAKAVKSSKSSRTRKENKGRTFKVRKCPDCGSNKVNVVIGEEASGKWECKKCKWEGRDIEEEELSEDEFMNFLEKQGEYI